jgi:formylglycine-generating enzyme required for sulfatase activity
MVIIPAGKFKMGDIQGTGDDSEKPVHEVTVKSFAMGCYPVTFAEYNYFCEATNREKPNDRGWGRNNRPVINVSWEDAVAYTDWLSEQTGHTYRLPSEAQWEYVARAGTETDYWWGNEIDKEKANYDLNIGKTSPVDSFKPNPYGLYDTVGNVWEWCADSWHKNYKGAPTDGSVWEKDGDNSLRVVLGGAWFNKPRNVRVSYRYGWWRDARVDFGGFRPAKL